MVSARTEKAPRCARGVSKFRNPLSREDDGGSELPGEHARVRVVPLNRHGHEDLVPRVQLGEGLHRGGGDQVVVKS